MMLTILLLQQLSFSSQATDHYDFVQEVLDEDDSSQDHDYATMDDASADAHDQERRRKQEDDAERLRQEKIYAQEQERVAEQARNARIQLEREQAFESELAKMSEEKRRLARQQQKKDAAIVQKVLRAAERGNLYAVLGLRNNREVRIPGRSLTIVPGYATINIPELRFLHVTAPMVRRAFRDRAKLVHPDKSKDSRAAEAFVAVENAASILLDEASRAEYDRAVVGDRRWRRDRVTGALSTGVQHSLSVTRRIFGTVKTLLGPFSVPVLILSVLVF
jgi:DnaJ domain